MKISKLNSDIIASDFPWLVAAWYVFKILGHGTPKIVKEPCKVYPSHQFHPKFVSCTGTIFYNFFLICFLLTVDLNMLISNIFFGMKNISEISRVINAIETLFLAVTVLSLIPYNTFYQSNLCKIFNKIIQLDCEFSDTYFTKSNCKFIVFLFISNVFWCFTLCVSGKNNFYPSYISVLYYIPLMTNLWFPIQYALIIKLLCIKFHIINDCLYNCLDYNKFIPRADKYLKKVLKRNPNAQFSSLQSLHSTLCDISNEADEYYGTPIVFCLAQYLYTLTLYGYFIMYFVRDNRPLVNVHCALWFCTVFGPFYILAKKVNEITSEVKKTGVIVQELIICTKNPKQQDQLINFSNYILHTNLEFTAKGFFSLDGTLLHSLLSAVTTYVIIFIQFDSSHESKTCDDMLSLQNYTNV